MAAPVESSRFWSAPGGAGDGSATYTRDQLAEVFRSICLSDATTQGPLSGLVVSGTASPLTLAVGAACVYGYLYFCTTAGDLAVSTPVVGTTGGHVVLRVNWTAQTVRAFAVRNTDGVNNTPALTQAAGTTWEIRIATFTITTGGGITVTDARTWAHWPGRMTFSNADGMTAGRVPFADGNGRLNENAGLSYDPNNNRLGIGTAVPLGPLDLDASTPYVRFSEGGSMRALLGVSGAPSTFVTTDVDNDTVLRGETNVIIGIGIAEKVRVTNTGMGIGDTTPDYSLDVIGQAEISPVAPAPPLIIGVNWQGQTVDGLAADEIDTLSFRRQGGSASDWSAVGTNNYTPTTMRMQAGAHNNSGASGSSGLESVSFPAAFAQPPLVYVIPQNNAKIVCAVDTTSASAVSIRWRTFDGSSIIGISLIWLAIGPE